MSPCGAEEESAAGTILNLTAEEWAYSRSVGIVGAILSFVGVLLVSNKSVDAKLLCGDASGKVKLDLARIVAIFLFFWWALPPGSSPWGTYAIFYYTGNGFFAAGCGRRLPSAWAHFAQTQEATGSALAPFATMAICCLILISVLPQLFGLHAGAGDGPGRLDHRAR